MSVVERSCPLLLFQLDSEATPKTDELSKKLESDDDTDKIQGLREIIHCIISGMDMSRLTMQVIKFCLRSRNHNIKKLLSIFWEVLDKKDANTGKLKPEMILVCNHLLNDLKHANEYIRGSTCRLLCRIDESEILEQLVPQVLANLEHRHSYVRKNAVLALMSIYTNHSELVPDAPQRVSQFVMKEGNSLAQRNAFLMLSNCDLRNALDFFLSVQRKISTFPETMQIAVLELMRKVCRTLPVPKSIFVKCAASLLDSASNAVVYEAAATLLSLTPLDSAVNRALEAYTRLLQLESDQNVKIIVINRLLSLRNRYERNLRLVLMDIVRALSTPNLDVRRKILSLVLELASPQNIEDIISSLKKEIIAANNVENDPQTVQYRNLLVETIHQCAVKFPEVASSVVHLLMNYLGDENAQAAHDVILFVKEIVEEYPDLRNSILDKLLDSFRDIRSETVYRVALWIFGEYADSSETIERTIAVLSEAIGELPLQNDSRSEESTDDDESKEDKSEALSSAQPTYFTRTVVLDDGTYAQETMTMHSKEELSEEAKASQTQFRILIKSGEYYLAAVMASTLVKLILRLRQKESLVPSLLNELTARSLLLISCVLRFGGLSSTKRKMDNDTRSRMLFALHTLLGKSIVDSKIQNSIYLEKTRKTFGMMLQRKRTEEKQKRETEKKAEQKTSNHVPFDTLLKIRQLKGSEFSEFDEDDALNIKRAVGNKVLDENLKTRLSRVHQLTGFSDPVYAEACVTVHQFDIVLDFLIINNTKKTLQNLALELHTSGDLKLVEKPQKMTLAAGASSRIQASIKVSSTENGVIFGNIVYDTTGATADKNIVVMNCIHMDIMDYVHPWPCSEQKFRDMWVEFEWENKVPVNTDICDLHEYLRHVGNITNMQQLTPTDSFSKECQFLAANLHAKSIFGEHALMNVSIELKEENESGKVKKKVTGHIRIRCKSQGIALSLGEKITNKQKRIEN